MTSGQVELPATTGDISTLGAYSGLLQTLYASLWDDKGMEQSLIAFKEYFNSSSATLMALQQSPRHMRYGWTVGVPEQYERWYIENDMVSKDPSVDLFESESPKTQGFVAASALLGDLALIETVSEEFKPWLIAEDIVDSAGLVIPSAENEYLVLALQRNGTAGPFTEFEIQQLNLLAPHIKQTVQLFIKFYRQQSDNSSLQAAINTLHQPTIVLNELLQVRHINTAADTLIKNNSSIEIDDQQLVLADAEVHHQFMYHAWELAARGTESLGSAFNSIIILPRPGGNITITLSPMSDTSRKGRSCGVLLQIFDPQSQQVPSAERIQQIFQVTPTEAKLCELLVEGHTLKEIARIRDVSPHTVREQMRSIFKKTRYSRQSELVAAILRAAP